jgi:hypothetical protein
MIFNALVLFYPNKKIISVQSYDRLKLPHDEWIKRIVVNNKNITKDTIINQSISERPDYMIVDEFGKEIFDCAWYNIDMFSVERAIVSNLIDEIIHINEKALIIDLNKVKTSYKEIIQIVKIREINDRKIFTAIEFEPKSNEYNINLLSSSLDVAEFIKKKKVLRWTKDSKIFDYKDFNSIISEYFYNNVKVMEKLGIKKE